MCSINLLQFKLPSSNFFYIYSEPTPSELIIMWAGVDAGYIISMVSNILG